MKTIPAGLAAHLAGDTWTLATLWTITRVDSTVFRFTDHDRDLVEGGNTYKAAVGYVAKTITHGIDGAPDSTETAGVLDDIGIKAAELTAGLFDGAAVEVELVNWANTADGTAPLLKGKIGEVSTAGNQFTAELRGMAQQLARTIGRVITPGCDADLGDTRCGVNMASFTETGSASDVYLIDAIRWTYTDWEATFPGVLVFEAQVRASAGGADQATPNTNATASNFWSSDWPSYAFDDNSGTAWRALGIVGDWLQFDFDAAVVLYEYWFNYNAVGHGLDWTVTVKLAGSTDWTLVDTQSPADWGAPAGDTAFVVTRAAGTDTGSRIELFDPARNEADNYWLSGKITFTSGDNNGLVMDIKASHSTGRLVFWEPMPFPIRVGDTYSVHTGCDKTVATCRDIYSNIDNHRGFPYLRGISELLRGPQ